jgi:hypothetical protein
VERAVSSGIIAAGAAAVLALSALTLASTAPSPRLLGLASQALVAASTLASAAAYILGSAASRLALDAAKALDKDYRLRRGSMSHRERVREAERAALLLATGAAAKRLQTLWPIAAASLGVGGLYAASLAYTILWRTRQAIRPDERPHAPSPAAAYAVLFASLGLLAPLVAGWAARLARETREETKRLQAEGEETEAAEAGEAGGAAPAAG